MNTEKINSTSDSGQTEKKNSKAGKIVGRSAEVLGAAGLGAAATFTAYGMEKDDVEETVAPVVEPEVEDDGHSEVVEEVFDPNEIMIEDDDVVVEPNAGGAESEPEPVAPGPITREDILAINIDDVEVEPTGMPAPDTGDVVDVDDPSDYFLDPYIEPEPTTSELDLIIDDPTNLFADNDMGTGSADYMDDILNA